MNGIDDNFIHRSVNTARTPQLFKSLDTAFVTNFYHTD